MPVPPMPPGFEQIGNRPFSFYPPVVNVEHNEWHYRKATWSEVLVVNAKTAVEVWIPGTCRKEEVAGNNTGNLNNGVEVTRHQTFHL